QVGDDTRQLFHQALDRRGLHIEAEQIARFDVPDARLAIEGGLDDDQPAHCRAILECRRPPYMRSPPPKGNASLYLPPPNASRRTAGRQAERLAQARRSSRK